MKRRCSHGPFACRCRTSPRGEGGSALIEVIVIGVGILVPIGYLALAAATVQSAAFASQQGVREAARAFSSAATVREGGRQAEAAAELAFSDHGLDLPSDALRIVCSGGSCLAPGSGVEVEIAWSVPLPWLPAPIAGDAPVTVPIVATQRVPVDDYRGDPA